MSDNNVHDPRKHSVCAPFYGESGPAYTRIFRKNFITNLWGEVDEAGWSLAEHLLETDEGSPGNPIAGAAAYQAKATRLYNTRSKKAFALLRKHIEVTSFRAALGDQAILGSGLAALGLADEWFTGGASNLKLEKQNVEWQSVEISQFGIHANSIRMLERHLQTLNEERPINHVYSDNQLGARLLACFTFPASLQADAMKELHTPTLIHPAGTPGNDASGLPLAGQYDIQRMVTTYETYFRSQLDAGRIKSADPPKQAKPHTSNRVDGLSLEIAPKSWPELILYECEEVDEDGCATYEVEFANGNGSREMLCWNCQGLGHAQRDKSKPPGQDWVCPSPKKYRDPKEHIAALTKLAAARGGGARPRVKFGNRRTPGGPGPKNRFATRPKANQAELEGDDSDVDGMPVLTHDSGDEELSTAEISTAESAKFDDEVLNSKGDTANIDNDFKKAFGISLDMAEVFCPLADAEDNYVEDDLELDSSTTTSTSTTSAESPQVDVTFIMACCLLVQCAKQCVTILLGNLARGPARVARFLGPGCLFMLTGFALFSACTGSPVTSTAGEHTFSINELGCASNNSFPQHHATPFAKVSILREHGANPDSGATVTASDRKSLFPKSAVTEYNPKLSVTVANGITLPVELKGALVLKGRSTPYTTSTKKFVPVVVLGAILVPGLRKNTVLLSPRNLYRLQGVKVYFNDELHMLLPNGTKVYLAETETAYMIIGDWNVTDLSIEAVNTISQWMQGNASAGWHPSSSNGSAAAMVSEVTSDRIQARCM